MERRIPAGYPDFPALTQERIPTDPAAPPPELLKSVVSGVYDPLVNTGKINEISTHCRVREHDVNAIDKYEVNTGCSMAFFV